MALVVVVALGASIAAVAVTTATASDDEDPPAVPAAYYGDVTIAGEPAEPGTEIVALVDDEPVGSIIVNETGAYGGPAASDEKLVVPEDGSNQLEAGDTITFEVEGVETGQIVEWEPSALEQVDLSIAERPASFAVTIEADETVTAGETIAVDTTVENSGDLADTQPIELRVNDTVVTTTNVTLGPGEKRDEIELSYTTDEDDIGELELVVSSDDESAVATVTVEEDDDSGPTTRPAPTPLPDPAAFGIVDVELSQDQLEAGDAIETVTVELENTGETAGETTLAFLVDDDVIDSIDEITLDAGERDTVAFTDVDVGDLEPGEYTVSIQTANESIERPFRIVAPTDPDPETEPTERATLDVTVVDAADGSPIADASVELNGVDEATGADGMVEIDDLEHGTYTVTVTAEGYETVEETIVLEAATNELTVELEATDDDVTDVDDEVDDDDIPGFSVLGALAAVSALVALLRLRVTERSE